MQRTMNTQSSIPQHTVHDAPDPECMTRALVWPNTLSLRAKMVIQFLDDSAALYESDGRLLVREEKHVYNDGLDIIDIVDSVDGVG